MSWRTVLFFGLIGWIGLIRAEGAASVTVAWNRSVGTNVAGYKVYDGTKSRAYTAVVNAGNATNATIAGLIEGATYFFAATAYDSSGLESDYSAEISYSVPQSGGLGQPRPTLRAERLDKAHVLLSWPTNFAGFKLRWSTDLRTWTSFAAAPVLSGTNWTFVDSTGCCPDWWYYRLQK